MWQVADLDGSLFLPCIAWRYVSMLVDGREHSCCRRALQNDSPSGVWECKCRSRFQSSSLRQLQCTAGESGDKCYEASLARWLLLIILVSRQCRYLAKWQLAFRSVLVEHSYLHVGSPWGITDTSSWIGGSTSPHGKCVP